MTIRRTDNPNVPAITNDCDCDRATARAEALSFAGRSLTDDEQAELTSPSSATSNRLQRG